MLVGNFLFALALLLGCERRSGTIHTACWKPWLMGADRLVVRSVPSPDHGMNQGFQRLRSIPRSCIIPRAAGEPWNRSLGGRGSLRRVGVQSEPHPSPASAFLFVCLFMALGLPRCPPTAAKCRGAFPSLPGTGGGGESSGRGKLREGKAVEPEGARGSLPALSGLLRPRPLLKPCRATPSPAAVTCGNPWMNSGMGDALPLRGTEALDQLADRLLSRLKLF